MNPLPPLSPIPAEIVSANDYLPYAKERMSSAAWAYFSGGSADESLLQRNLDAFKKHSIWPRSLASLKQGNTNTRILDATYPFPIFLAPVAYQRMAHPQGETASALAAAAMKTPFIISMQASCSLEDISVNAPGPQWLQWYWQTDKTKSEALLKRAVALGIQALVLTVDAPVNGIRNREQRAGFALPTGIDAVNLTGFERKEHSMGVPGTSPLFGSGFLDNTPDWNEVAAFVSQCPLPVFFKGIMHPDDARLAIQAGAKGIVVSNHGGRTLDAAPASLDALPGVYQAVAGQVPILLDGGIRRGSDIFIALASGADAVLIGRPYIYALAAAGAPGVAHILHILRTELEVCMALAGCRTLADIRPECLC